LYFVHADHLNTPRLVADATGTTVWRWDQGEPFGNNPADEDPDANSVAFDLPLRLPGQRYDKETNLHYNYFRDYDPSLGRYLEADPLGVEDGVNPFAYVHSDPLYQVDEHGLFSRNREERSRERTDRSGAPVPPGSPSSSSAASVARYHRCWENCYEREKRFCYLLPIACLAIGTVTTVGTGLAVILPAVVVTGDLCFDRAASLCSKRALRCM
jgi:RHS repeat-associated protein